MGWIPGSEDFIDSAISDDLPMNWDLPKYPRPDLHKKCLQMK